MKSESNKVKALPGGWLILALALGLALALTFVISSHPSHAAFPGQNGKIAFTSAGRHSQPDIYVMNADGSNLIRLTNNPDYDVEPDWSPDGTKIAFVTRRDRNFEIYVMNADGSNPTNLTNNPLQDSNGVSWSPDGTKIAFLTDRDGNVEVYVMNADGSNPINLTNNPAVDYISDWSPDGTKIAFMTRRDGDGNYFEIYVMNAADGSNQTRLTNELGFDGDPDWQPIPLIQVVIDIKPGSFPNCFNNDGNGVIPVAILGSASFDVTQVDAATVELERMPVKAVGKSNKLLASIENVDGDVFNDLVVKIEDIDGTFQVGETTATLTGNLLPAFGSTPIQGTDTICIVP